MTSTHTYLATKTSKLRTLTIEAWGFAGLASPLFLLTNAAGLDGVALGIFAATLIVSAAALIGTFALGVRSLIVG